MTHHPSLHRKLRPTQRRGIALFAAMIAVIVVAGLASVMFTTAQSEMTHAQVTRSTAELIHLAEAGTVAAESVVLDRVANSLPVPDGGSVQVGPQVATYTIRQFGDQDRETDDVGFQTTHVHYWIQSQAELGQYRKQINRMIDVGMIPIFQFAIFYDKDLEMQPGPSLTLTGRVHSNADVYAGCGGSSTVTISSKYFRCVGDMYRRRKESGIATAGIFNVQKYGLSDYPTMYNRNEMTALGIPSDSGYDSSFLGYDADQDGYLDGDKDWADFTVGSLERWGGTLQTGSHGMKRIEPPRIGSIKRFEEVGDGLGDYTYDPATGKYSYVGSGGGDFRKSRFYAEAGLSIVDGAAYDASGKRLLLPPGTITDSSMYDAREKLTVTLTEIDMNKLRTSGYMPANGLIYASRTESSSTQPNGIRLRNGGNLGQPLTVVSENPVYVWGDYNTMLKQPAAIISDAVNLLSKAWNNSKVRGSLPKATETTYNFAMITGGDETTPGTYNGGFENLPRFHEDWTKVKCRIAGSFVKIFASDLARAMWRIGGDVYWPPERLWDYDSQFNDPTKLPPYTPIVAQVKASGWWE